MPSVKTVDRGGVQPPWYIRGERDTRDWLEFHRALTVPPSGKEQGGLFQRVYGLCQRNPAFLIHNWLQIRTKDGGRIPFDKWTPAQRRLYAAVDKARADNKPVRVVILKSRQMGISTEAEALLFWRTAFFADATSLVMAHEEGAVKNLFWMFKLYHESLPEWMRPKTSNFNEDGIVFSEPLSSRLQVKTAALGGSSKANTGKGRSATYHAAHMSEPAFYAEPARLFGGLNAAISKSPGTFVFVESTANGHGNWYHSFWQKTAAGWEMRRGADGKVRWTCVDPNASTSMFVPVFLSWLEHPEYSTALPASMEREYFLRHLDEEEQALVDIYGATAEQLNWRRITLTDDCGGDLNTFHQEYPVTPDEAFVASGRRVFDFVALERDERRVLAEPQPKRGNIDLDPNGKPILQRDPYGSLWVYKEPVAGASYAIGVDSSYGKQHGDYSCAQVLRCDNWEQVATLHGRIEPDELAVAVNALGLWYNEALLVVEIDGPGIHTDKKLGELGYYKRYLRVNIDRIDQKRSPNWGWKMSTKSRANMVAALKAAVREGDLILHDAGTIKEMREWMLVTGPTGRAVERPSDPSHGHDDRITSIGIALQGGIVEQGVGDAPVSKPEGTSELAQGRIPLTVGAHSFSSVPEEWSQSPVHDVLGTDY